MDLERERERERERELELERERERERVKSFRWYCGVEGHAIKSAGRLGDYRPLRSWKHEAYSRRYAGTTTPALKCASVAGNCRGRDVRVRFPEVSSLAAIKRGQRHRNKPARGRSGAHTQSGPKQVIKVQ